MKKTMISMLTGIALILSLSIAAQDPPPPPNGNGGNPNSGNTPVGGGAPVGSGLFVLLAMGAAYGGKKVFQMKNSDKIS